MVGRNANDAASVLGSWYPVDSFCGNSDRRPTACGRSAVRRRSNCMSPWYADAKYRMNSLRGDISGPTKFKSVVCVTDTFHGPKTTRHRRRRRSVTRRRRSFYFDGAPPTRPKPHEFLVQPRRVPNAMASRFRWRRPQWRPAGRPYVGPVGGKARRRSPTPHRTRRESPSHCLAAGRDLETRKPSSCYRNNNNNNNNNNSNVINAKKKKFRDFWCVFQTPGKYL